MAINNVNAATACVEYSLQTDYDKGVDPGNTKTLIKNTSIIDTGASFHISNSMMHLKNVKPVNSWFVVLPNGLRLKVVYQGDIYLSDSLILYDVLYVPGFAYNLISVTKFPITNYYFHLNVV